MPITQTTGQTNEYMIGNRKLGPNDCAIGGRTVTPDDETDLPNGPCRAIYVGTAGNLTVIGLDGQTCTYANHPVGYAPISALRILNTGTVAQNIVALY